jgi:hypothetical protein
MTEMKKRPDFLTVLCILTWVGSGIVLIGQLITLATASFTKELTDIAEEGMDEAMEEFAEEAPEFGSLFSNIMGQSIHALEHLTELALVRIFGVLPCSCRLPNDVEPKKKPDTTFLSPEK